jgi:vacuolar-type H+-ATPase subunit F/Vma7
MQGLQMVGVELAPVETPRDLALALVRHADRSEVRLLLISESVAEGQERLVNELREKTGKVFMLVPSHRGAAGLARRWLRERMESSIGVNLLSEK